MNYLICLLFIVLGVVFRILPHPPNFTPILSIALLSGLFIRNKYSILLPISIMLFSDILLGGNPMSYWVYTSIVLIILIGYFVKNNVQNILINSVFCSLIFFIITNFGVWLNGGYSYTFNGLLTCYYMAIPFFKNTLISTSLFSLIIFYLVKYIEFYFISSKKIIN